MGNYVYIERPVGSFGTGRHGQMLKPEPKKVVAGSTTLTSTTTAAQQGSSEFWGENDSRFNALTVDGKTWAETYPGRDAHASIDGDGLADGVEWALGRDPNSADYYTPSVSSVPRQNPDASVGDQVMEYGTYDAIGNLRNQLYGGLDIPLVLPLTPELDLGIEPSYLFVNQDNPLNHRGRVLLDLTYQPSADWSLGVVGDDRIAIGAGQFNNDWSVAAFAIWTQQAQAGNFTGGLQVGAHSLEQSFVFVDSTSGKIVDTTTAWDLGNGNTYTEVVSGG